MTTIVFLINLIALGIVLRYGLPQPFPWASSVWLAVVLLLGGLFGGIERGVAFVTLLSVIIITCAMYTANMAKVFAALAVLLTLFIVADALRLINTPDITMTTGETFGLIRRAYLLEHPNVKAGWLLLLSLSPLSLIGILFAQSRGALLGYLAALVRYIPKRFYIHALVAGVIAMGAAVMMRAGSALWRFDVWTEALGLFLARPLAGFGTGTYITLTNTGMATAHNAVLTIAAENGVIGLSAFGIWFVLVGLRVMQSASLAKYNLFAFTVQQMVDDQWLHPVTAILLGATIGICLSGKLQHGSDIETI